MSNFSSILFAILMFSFLIFVHELGHFIAAKRSGVQVNEFAMFMGPAIFKKKVGETTYSLRCIPIGGYCAMEGEDMDTEDPRSFQKAAWWKRLIILVAGSGMNLIAGFLIVLCFNFFLWPAPSLQVESLYKGSCLEQSGVQPGDVILKIGKYEINSSDNYAAALPADGEARTEDILILRDGQQILLEDALLERRDFVDESGEEVKGKYGISSIWIQGEPYLRQDFSGIFKETWEDCAYFAVAIWESLGMLLTGQVGVQDMAGPVGIVATMTDIATSSSSALSGFVQLLSLGGFIAINLGIMNLLPIPALDGGRVLALLITTPIKAITKKPVNPKIEAYIHAGGMILLLIFMGLIMFQDIFKIFKG